MTQPALLICIIGIDGSGKTTQARLLVDWLTSQNIKAKYIWSRGEVRTLRRIFLSIGRKALGTSSRKIANDIESSHHYQSRKSRLMKIPFVRILWSISTYIEHIVQINVDIRPKLQDGYCVVCDRYFWDSNVDLAVLNNMDPERLSSKLNRFMWKLIPKPDITFVIDIPPAEAQKRKDDIPSLEYVKKRAELYRYLAKCYSLIEIDGQRDVTTINTEVIESVIKYKGEYRCPD